MEKGEETDQFLIIQKLYAELDEEREASATAATEALSVISRLQEEKAKQKTEAFQYKRMAEEEAHHNEELIVIFQELLCQKEVEIASLKFHVQDCMTKLSDNNGYKTKLNQASLHENYGGLHRKLSLKPERSATGSCLFCVQQDEEIKETNMGSPHSRYVEEDTIYECESENYNPHSIITQIDYRNAREGSSDLLISDDPYSSITEEMETKPCPFDMNYSFHDKGLNNITSTNSHDIFEVPQDHCTLSKLRKLASLKSSFRDKGKHELTESIPKDAMDNSKNYEWIKNEIICCANKLCTPRKEVIPNDLQFAWNQKNVPSSPCLDAEHLERRLQKLEEDRLITSHETCNKEEQMKLLKEIHEQINMIQSYIHRQKPKKRMPQDAPTYVSLMEAMLSFSI